MSDITDQAETALAKTDEELLDELADGLVKRRLGTPAMLALETCKPLNFVASSVMVFFSPFVHLIWKNPTRYESMRKLLEKRESIELLLRRIEARM